MNKSVWLPAFAGCLSAIVSFAWLAAPVCVAAGKGGAVTAQLAYRSWVDTGAKAIFLPDNSGYLIITGAHDHKVQVFRGKLTGAQAARLKETFVHNDFAAIPQEVTARVTDGTDTYIYRADSEGYHKVHQYMEKNQALDTVRNDMHEIMVEQLRDKSKELTLETMLSELKERLQKMPEEDPRRQCLSDILNLTVRHLVGAHELDYETGKEYMRKDQYW